MKIIKKLTKKREIVMIKKKKLDEHTRKT